MQITETLYEKVLKAMNMIKSIIDSNSDNTVAVTCAFGRSSLVLLHLINRSVGTLPIMFSNTGCHHPELSRFKEQFFINSKWQMIEVKPKYNFNKCNYLLYVYR